MSTASKRCKYSNLIVYVSASVTRDIGDFEIIHQKPLYIRMSALLFIINVTGYKVSL